MNTNQNPEQIARDKMLEEAGWVVKKALDHSKFLEETLSKETFEEATGIYRQARKK